MSDVSWGAFTSQCAKLPLSPRCQVFIRANRSCLLQSRLIPERMYFITMPIVDKSQMLAGVSGVFWPVEKGLYTYLDLTKLDPNLPPTFFNHLCLISDLYLCLSPTFKTTVHQTRSPVCFSLVVPRENTELRNSAFHYVSNTDEFKSWMSQSTDSESVSACLWLSLMLYVRFLCLAKSFFENLSHILMSPLQKGCSSQFNQVIYLIINHQSKKRMRTQTR